MARSSLLLVWAAAMGAAAHGCADTDEPAADTGDGSDATTDDPSADDGPSSQPTAPADDDDGDSSGPPTSASADSDDGTDAESSTGGEPLPPDPCIEANTCPPGEWIEVTPAELAPLDFGPGPVVVDPGHPSDLYMGGGGDGLWKSTDYGNTWAKINEEIGYVPMGLILAVAGTEPATLWVAGYNVVHKSTDGGESFVPIAMELPAELYSIDIDPYDDDHLISGIHEADGLVESIDGGETWEILAGTDFPPGGRSWYPFFLDTGDATTTRDTWFAIAQDGGSATITTDGGASWTIPPGIEGLQHPHGNTQIFQRGTDIFAGGVAGPGGGVYRSTDMGASFERVAEGNVGIVWGSDDAVYSMWGWACSMCDLGASFMTAPLPGDDWSSPPVPADLIIGANHIAVTSDGTHDVFVGTMWSSGVWRYVEP